LGGELIIGSNILFTARWARLISWRAYMYMYMQQFMVLSGWGFSSLASAYLSLYEDFFVLDCLFRINTCTAVHVHCSYVVMS
jgi:hypothetical protein